MQTNEIARQNSFVLFVLKLSSVSRDGQLFLLDRQDVAS